MIDERVERAAVAVAQIPHCVYLGMSIKAIENGWVTACLPWREDLIGNPTSRVISGGAITTLMDTVCGIAAMCALPQPEVAPTLDLRIDYMQPAYPGKPVFGRAEIYRMSRHILFAHGIAYQGDDEETVVAHCVATFMRTGHKPGEPHRG